MKLIGYVRLSKDTRGKGHSLDAQRESIARWCRENSHTLVSVVVEVASGGRPDKLEARRLAIAAILAGLADGMVVRDLDRVSRSVIDAADLLHSADRFGWRLVGAVDDLDTADRSRALEQHIKIAVAEEERRKISERTKLGMVTAKRNGSKIGKPRQVPPAVERRIVKLSRDGLSPYRIAQALDAANIPTAQSGRSWSPSVVRDVITRNRKVVA